MTTDFPRLTLVRYPDWPIRFNNYVAALKGRPFEYGALDCCRFVAGAIKAITGVDPMEDIPEYSEETVNQVIAEKCYQGSILKTLYKKFGKSLPGPQGRRGDIAWYEGCCGIVINRHALFFNADGYQLIPLSKLRRVFRVG